MESIFLLAKASKLHDSLSQMVLVATFASVCINSLSDRLNKPFNPILGETFQFVDEEVGVRVIAEQVSHHPPITAFNFQSSFAHINGNAAPKISFGGMGQSIQVYMLIYYHVYMKLLSYYRAKEKMKFGAIEIGLSMLTFWNPDVTINNSNSA